MARLVDQTGVTVFEGELEDVAPTPAVSVVAGLAAVDIHAIGSYALKVASIHDNEWDYNPLAAIPDGLGLAFAFDGSSADLTTTEAGVWAFTLSISFLQDATYVGAITVPFTGFQTLTAPAVALGGVNLAGCEVLALPSGATSQAALGTYAGATANPYTVEGSLSIVRLG